MPYQQFPQSGLLSRNMDRDLPALERDLTAKGGPVFCYVATSFKHVQGRYVQEGSGPNFQGDVITLCTCKHQMRSSLSRADWVGAWVAGFTGRSTIPGASLNGLVYLMKVRAAHASQRDLWNALPEVARLAKAADAHPLGDVFQPIGPLGDPFDVRSYVPPCPDHAHCGNGEWHTDINHVARSGRRPALLEGDPELSFLWTRPLIGLQPPPLARDFEKNRFAGLRGFFGQLVQL
jgi:hypothetical protein